jgi:hypothetical protein
MKLSWVQVFWVGITFSSGAWAGIQYIGPGQSYAFTVPAGVTSLTIEATSGGGGGGGSCYGVGGTAGTDGTQTVTTTVTPGEVVQVQTQYGGQGGCGGGGGGAGGSVWVTGPDINYFFSGANGGDGSGGGCYGACGGNGGDSYVTLSWYGLRSRGRGCAPGRSLPSLPAFLTSLSRAVDYSEGFPGGPDHA